MKNDNKPKFPIYTIINHFEAISFNSDEITVFMRSLYYALLNISNRMYGATNIRIATDYIMHLSKIGSPDTLYKALEMLQNLELIKYTKGKNRYSTPKVELLYNKEIKSLLESYSKAIYDTGNVSNLHSRYNYINNKKDGDDSLDRKDAPRGEIPRAQKKIPFEVFWALFSKNASRKEAKKIWDELSFDTQLEIVLYLPKYVESTPEKKYRKNPDNFLKEEIWKNDIINKGAREAKEMGDDKGRSLDNEVYESNNF